MHQKVEMACENAPKLWCGNYKGTICSGLNIFIHKLTIGVKTVYEIYKPYLPYSQFDNSNEIYFAGMRDLV